MQSLVSNKFIGHGIVIGIFVLMPILFNFGWENTLYLYGNTPPYTYSDMNGYGHFVPGLFWAIVYWLSISCFLATLSIAFARRGADDGWRARTRLALQRAPRVIPAAALFLFIATGSGVWYYYNSHVQACVAPPPTAAAGSACGTKMYPLTNRAAKPSELYLSGAPILLGHGPLHSAE